MQTPARLAHDDDDDVTVLWWRAGTVYQLAAIPDRAGALKLLADGGWELEAKTWWGGPAIHVIPRGAPFSLWPFRLEPDGDVLAWYCNLQAPLVRTAEGFDTNDWTLDIVASPDLSSWQWKDEDELEEGNRVGLYSDDDVATIRAAGQQVIALIESKAPIFDAWKDWLPDA